MITHVITHVIGCAVSSSLVVATNSNGGVGSGGVLVVAAVDYTLYISHEEHYLHVVVVSESATHLRMASV